MTLYRTKVWFVGNVESRDVLLPSSGLKSCQVNLRTLGGYGIIHADGFDFMNIIFNALE